MSVILRSEKGSALTHAELDGNFSTLQQQIAEKANETHTHGLGDINGLQDALDNKIDQGDVNVPNGLVQLDPDGKIPCQFLNDCFDVASKANTSDLIEGGKIKTSLLPQGQSSGNNYREFVGYVTGDGNDTSYELHTIYNNLGYNLFLYNIVDSGFCIGIVGSANSTPASMNLGSNVWLMAWNDKESDVNKIVVDHTNQQQLFKRTNTGEPYLSFFAYDKEEARMTLRTFYMDGQETSSEWGLICDNDGFRPTMINIRIYN